ERGRSVVEVRREAVGELAANDVPRGVGRLTVDALEIPVGRNVIEAPATIEVEREMELGRSNADIDRTSNVRATCRRDPPLAEDVADHCGAVGGRINSGGDAGGGHRASFRRRVLAYT